MDGTPEEHIFAYETALKIYEAVFYDGNFLFYHCRVAGIHKGLARCYARLQDKDRTLAHLKLAKAHANAYDGMPECEHHYSGLFLSKAAFNTKTISKNFAENETGLLKNALQEKIYDFLRADPEFTCFAESLGL